MFGMGGTEILVILIVALLFLGPDKLPDAAKKISKGIRDIKKQSRVLQQTIEDDENIGGAIRDLKSALRGEDEPLRPRPIKPKQIEAVVATAATAALPDPDEHAATEHPATEQVAASPEAGGEPTLRGVAAPTAPDDKPRLTMPATAGEADDDVPAGKANEDAALAALVKPAPNTIARSTAPAAPAAPSAEPSEPSEPKHG